ncbi:TPA: hypothetical protein QDB15_006822 [Burkholderia vietnamiensis]|nr:hypothetical protein [Burkholderia vietnamiensis]
MADPQPPTVLYGATPADAVADAEAWAEGARDAKGRKYRADGLCLLAGVVSLPASDQDRWPAYRDAAVEHLRELYGDRLRSVVEHTDEAHPHFHFYVVPRPGERFDDIHAGRKASAEAASRGELKGAQNRAYCEAMRGWQNEFFRSCGMAHGLTRLGPKRQRLSRDEWKAQQAQARFSADAKAQHRAARKKGYREGYAAGQEAGHTEASAMTERVSAAVAGAAAGAVAGVLGRWHTPTRKAAQEVADAAAQLEAERKKRKGAEARHAAIQKVLSDNNTALDRANAAAAAARAEAAETKTQNEALRAEVQRLRPDPSPGGLGLQGSRIGRRPTA